MLTAVLSLPVIFTKSCPCWVIRSKGGLLRPQASSSTRAARSRQRGCKGGRVEHTGPFPKGCAGALPCCPSQPCPLVAFPHRQQRAGAPQAPRPHRWQDGAQRLQLTHGVCQLCGTLAAGTSTHGNSGRAWQSCWTCPAQAGTEAPLPGFCLERTHAKPRDYQEPVRAPADVSVTKAAHVRDNVWKAAS